VESADLDEENGELRLDLSGGSSLRVIPGAHEAEDDPPNWKLLTPDGLALIFGPGGRWQLNRANESTGLPLRHDLRERSVVEDLAQAEYAEARAKALLVRARALQDRDSVDAWEKALLEAGHPQLLIILAVGLSIVSIAVAAAALAFALH
jgi:hypothetical protein